MYTSSSPERKRRKVNKIVGATAAACGQNERKDAGAGIRTQAGTKPPDPQSGPFVPSGTPASEPPVQKQDRGTQLGETRAYFFRWDKNKKGGVR